MGVVPASGLHCLPCRSTAGWASFQPPAYTACRAGARQDGRRSSLRLTRTAVQEHGRMGVLAANRFEESWAGVLAVWYVKDAATGSLKPCLKLPQILLNIG